MGDQALPGELLIALACPSTIELISLEADMSEKSALFMARTTRFHEFARSLTTTLGVEVSLATPIRQLRRTTLTC